MARYDIGDVAVFTATFTDEDDVVQDPSGTISITVKEPSGTETTYVYLTEVNLTKVSTGVYQMLIDLDASGTWYYRWFATGTGKAAGERKIEVRTSQIV